MTKFFLYLALASFAFLTSCSQSEIERETILINAEYDTTSEEGIVDFTIDNQNNIVLEKDALILNNSSINAVSYNWDFGNGDTSTEANPYYAYDQHGTYPVKLTITDRYGNTQEVSHDITVICLFDNQIHGSN